MIHDTKFKLLFYIIVSISVEAILLYTMGPLCRSGSIIFPDLHNDTIVYNLVIIYKKPFKKSVARECFLCLFTIYSEHSRSLVTKTQSASSL